MNKAADIYNKLANTYLFDVSWRQKDAEELALGLDLLPVNPVIVDVGTHWGGSSSFMSRYFDKKAKVYTIDCEEQPETQSCLADNNITFLHGDSLEIARAWEYEQPDMIFLDADHHYDMVRREIIVWGNKLRAGGILAGHDYSLIADDCQVKEAVDKMPQGKWEKISCKDVWVFRKRWNS